MADYPTYKGLDNVALQSPTTKVLSDNNYMAKAINQYNPSYNMKVTGLQDTLQNNLSNLENSKGTIDANYNKAVINQNLQNQATKNNISNDALNRGLGRSSIVTSGLASADVANNRALAGIMDNKVNALNTIAMQQANASAETGNQLNTMAANRLDDLQSLSDKMKNSDLDRYNNELNANRNFYMQQLNYNQGVNQLNNSNYWKNIDQGNWDKQFNFNVSNADRNYNLQKLNADRNYELQKLNSDRTYEINSLKSKNGKQSQVDTAAYANFNALETPQDQYALLNNPDFIKSVSPSVYKALQAQYQKNLKASGISESMVKASQPTYDYANSGSDTYGRSR